MPLSRRLGFGVTPVRSADAANAAMSPRSPDSTLGRFAAWLPGVFAAEGGSCSHARRAGARPWLPTDRAPAGRCRRHGFSRAGCASGVDGLPSAPRRSRAADTGRFRRLPLVHDLRGRRGHAHSRAGSESLAGVHDSVQAAFQRWCALVAQAATAAPHPSPICRFADPRGQVELEVVDAAANSTRGQGICASLARSGWDDLSRP